MVKKGKEKSSSSSGTTASRKPPAEDDFIIFTNSTKEGGGKGKRGGPSDSVSRGPGTSSANNDGPSEVDGPPKPTVKQIIGGSSWTGKLPVNLLSEHCQKQKWERPEYDTRKTKEGFSVFVRLSAKNPKTGEITRLEPFKLPPSHVHLAYKPTALEAKHFAATYALFRVCSMKNLHMTLPPDYRSLWRGEFEALKKQDIKEGKAWLYEADPFAALREREEAKVAKEKQRAEQQAAREKAASMPGAAGLVLMRNSPGGGGVGSGSGSGGGGGGGGGFNPMKGWMTVPKIEMGNKTRSLLEGLLRRKSVWNPHGVVMAPAEMAAVLQSLRGLGFRESHVEEAVEECKDREETLEWLLLHVPEDDLPRWALPESYTAGVTVGATDLRREGAIKRLAQSGYSAELCKRVFDESGGDEGRAAEVLQGILLSSGAESTVRKGHPANAADSWRDPDEMWIEEMESLESVFGEQLSRPTADVCQIRLVDVKDGPTRELEAAIQFRKSPHYPEQLILSVVAQLPAYIKLSVIKRALAYMDESLQGEEMKIYFVISWIQEEINDIIQRPGVLRDIAAVSSTASEERPASAVRKANRRPQRRPKAISWTPDKLSREEWLRRQESPAYRKMLGQRQKLPAWQVRDVVVKTVIDNQVTIISGETGSGKSTQSVQFILDDLYSKGLGHAANIVVTQPRRISALGLADRVSEERCCSQVGQEVGYSIRGESRTGPQTRINFVTTGVLLRRLQVSGGRIEDVVASLADVSHVVIDEVHERSLDTDFLLTILRDVLRRRRDLKVVLMSATLDSTTFRDYFVSDGIKVGMVEIAGRTFPVTDYYLDDVIRMTEFGIENVRADVADPVAKAIQNLGSRINYNLLVETVRAIDGDLSRAKKSGGILIFLPGVAEINRSCNMLRALTGLHVLALHASLETKEQRKVFTPPPSGKRKVVVATNVAETSITIDDIVVVVDTGRVKETSYDPTNNMRKLEESYASLAACKQRRGRAGRVSEGECYKLYTRNLEETQMNPRPEPEIRRVPLEQLCLSVRAMGIVDVRGFLARAPTPPDASAVEGAIKMLRRMGALDGEELTALGRLLAMVPADLRCGKLMVYGAIFGCLDECVTVSAILSVKSPFVSPQEKRDAAREARMRFASGGDGDLMTDLRAYQAWDEMVADFGVPQREVRAWCDDNFLSYQVLSDIASSRTQYYAALVEMGLVTPSEAAARAGRGARGYPSSYPGAVSSTLSSSASTSPSPNVALLRALTASAFAPQIARIQFPDKKFATSMSGAVELDPEAKTIKYFTQEGGRVFVHPSSTMFDSQGFPGGATFLSYFSMISTSKIFIRDLTPFNAYTLLLFAGPIELDTLGRGLVVDGWLRLRGWARIGVLVSRLRGMVDDLVALKVDNPAADLGDNDVIRVVRKLIEFDGLDA